MTTALAKEFTAAIASSLPLEHFPDFTVVPTPVAASIILGAAALEERVDVVRACIQAGWPLQGRNHRDNTPLETIFWGFHEGGIVNHAEEMFLEVLAALPPEADLRWIHAPAPMPPLTVAIARHSGFAKILIDMGVDVNQCIPRINASPLEAAAANGAVDNARLLLAHGAHLDALNANQETPLSAAVRHNWEEMALFLLELGASPHAKCGLPGDQLIHDATRGASLPLLQALAARGASVTAPGAEQKTPLHWAITQEWQEGVSWLLEHGASWDDADSQGRTPLTLVEIEGTSPFRDWAKSVRDLAALDAQVAAPQERRPLRI